jgi:hypothetical protein
MNCALLRRKEIRHTTVYTNGDEQTVVVGKPLMAAVC